MAIQSCDDDYHKSTGDGFEYDVLERDSIRLICILPHSTARDIHCVLEHHKDYFKSGVQYTAFSYCWGDPTLAKYIHVNGKPFAITMNLWQALSSIIQYHDPTRLYWADAVCLNQSDVAERNHQVHQMWRIYSHAEAVFAWLGLEDESTKAAFDVLGEVATSCTSLERHCQGWRKHHHFPSKLVLSSLNSLITNEFFGRTWIFQEYVQARELWIVCGQYFVASDTLSHFQRLWSGSPISELITNRQLHLDRSYAEPKPETYWKRISDVVFSYSMSQCSDRRDRIFALLGDPVLREMDPQGCFEPDYSITAEELALRFLGYCDEIIKKQTPASAEPDETTTVNMQSLVRSIIRALKLPCQLGTFFGHTIQCVNSIGRPKGSDKMTLTSGVILSCSGPMLRFVKQKHDDTNKQRKDNDMMRRRKVSKRILEPNLANYIGREDAAFMAKKRDNDDTRKQRLDELMQQHGHIRKRRASSDDMMTRLINQSNDELTRLRQLQQQKRQLLQSSIGAKMVPLYPDSCNEKRSRD